jgi:photosystem II stability/assembly factor-like uncharacterized protein
MKNLKFLYLISISLLIAACGVKTTTHPPAIHPTEIPTLIPTLPPPENTPTLPPTETATPPANPIQHMPAGTEVTITTIRMADLNRGWAIGTSATDPNDHILLTADGGTNWKDVTPPEGMDASGGKVATVFFKGADTAWVVYSSNVIQSPPGNAQVWKTTDGGATWSASQPIPPSAEMEFFSPGFFSFPDDQHGWLLVHAGAGMSHDYIYVYGTTDGGASWVKLVDPIASDQAGTGPSMGLWKTGMTFADAQKGWITYENGGVAPGVTLFQTLDGGYTWALQSLPAPTSQADLFTNQNYSCGAYNLAFLDAQKGSMVVTCMMGSGDIKKSWLYRTSDAGASWQSNPLPAAAGNLQMVDAVNGYYVGGKIFRTTNGGASWTAVIPVTWSGQPDFVDMNNGWIVAVNDAERALVQTTNSAVNWVILKTVITK